MKKNLRMEVCKVNQEHTFYRKIKTRHCEGQGTLVPPSLSHEGKIHRVDSRDGMTRVHTQYSANVHPDQH